MKHLIDYDFFLSEKWFGFGKPNIREEYKKEKHQIWKNSFSSYQERFRDYLNILKKYRMNSDPSFKNELEQDLNFYTIQLKCLGKSKNQKIISVYKDIRTENLSDKQREFLLDMISTQKNKK
jgi:hypothetical protein